MKPGFIFVVFALGTLICVTCAAPSSSEIQRDDDSEMTDKELVKLSKQLANQLKLGDKELAQAEFLKSFLINNWRGILGGIGGLLRAINRRPAPPKQRSYYNPSYYRGGGYESAKGQESEDFKSRVYETLKELIATKEQDEEIDNDNDKVQAQVKKLEDLLAAKQQDKEDRDALTEDEEQLAAALKADDSADLEASQDDDDDDEDDDEDDDNEDDEAELQRHKRKRRRHNIRHRHDRRRGHRHRGGRHRGGHHHGGRGHRHGGRGRGGRRRTSRRSWLNNILNGISSFAGNFLGKFLSPSPAPAPPAYPPPPAYPAPPGYPSQYVRGRYESAKRQEKKGLELQQIDDDFDDTDDNDVKLQAQSEALEELEDLLAAMQQDEEFNDTDDDDTQLQAQSEVVKQLLKTLIAANQQDEEADKTDDKDARFQAQNESLKKDFLLALIQGYLE